MAKKFEWPPYIAAGVFSAGTGSVQKTSLAPSELARTVSPMRMYLQWGE
jgi:hypothetical protein